ncbi:dipeptidyl aminopeptidase [Paenibacillus apiarius]|uniref:Dipeptidyl aminopeptidase n=1 Tax=Paenibacillus apiarius TaxID=46240 RepID=A0ABT4DRG5_9BACL|nr:dipeptidyl aminopeptidase [Paenibacillus apiarius]MBN3524693.1 dipeptidyl aminopeptidase [Paenibacillus apiarius]MCY9515582.1 dipeptidyl aminopeptidase [Paenibacillus apiarius]MCY9519345.1 dipeptidyl aminopeptidase [Paenibacillus apiarius]MCY9550981.1 dipeptidyl aminopeptidase [Paenibacillus apiarius]MCY9558927.1 dipeptidyl aminopeptidase [Paenibacillus apiarius]
MECIVHFEVVHHGAEDVAKLRGLVMTPKGERPSPHDLEQMFSSMGYDVACKDEDSLVFMPKGTGSDVEEIHVKKLDMGEETYTPDANLRAIAEQLMSKPNRPM